MERKLHLRDLMAERTYDEPTYADSFGPEVDGETGRPGPETSWLVSPSFVFPKPPRLPRFGETTSTYTDPYLEGDPFGE
ncbi:MAG: hypothetical protein IPK71_12950 [Myxococcales bacterium]|nr:hypothetical protein [Myxococcales bacterium]